MPSLMAQISQLPAIQKALRLYGVEVANRRACFGLVVNHRAGGNPCAFLNTDASALVVDLAFVDPVDAYVGAL